MRRSSFIGLAALIAFSAAPVFACSCVRALPGSAPPHSITERTTAEPDSAAFEGTAIKAELHGNLIDAKEGDLIPADLDADYPFMLVSFDVTRSFPSDPRKTAEVRTGLGGGDCGFSFDVGKRYLVDAGKDEDGQLVTGICTQTAALDARQPSAEEDSSQTGEVCGHVVQPNPAAILDGRILLYTAGNKSPIPSGNTDVKEDNSFCAADLDPGEYILLFVAGNEGSPTAAAYFPGAARRSDAEKVEVSAGQHIQT